jgi:hypothetical protein
MGEYRLYCLDGLGGISKAEELEASNDAEAVVAAKAMKKSVKCELWQRERLVAIIPPETEIGAARG